ncbi:hypothetical protein KCM76_16845 [Zooshikella marina]|uniref:hypothetical protein n=1 Tax=Zooshikella ganghwensis TaxID=202772 RepID=UPI001BAFE42B|nr:hypothetical protein [Zooshikella ganghwensis]MBU2707665.1 hypothetical protein [Zooshikella ganghwensis]
MSQLLKTPPRPEKCQLCDRPEQLTKHHLIPRTYHSRRQFRKLFTKGDMVTRILWVCTPCHKNLHATISEKTLGLEYNSLEKLLNNVEIARFVAWIKDKPVGFKLKVNRKAK